MFTFFMFLGLIGACIVGFIALTVYVFIICCMIIATVVGGIIAIIAGLIEGHNSGKEKE